MTFTLSSLEWTSVSSLTDIAPIGVSVTVLMLWRDATGVGQKSESLSLSWMWKRVKFRLYNIWNMHLSDLFGFCALDKGYNRTHLSNLFEKSVNSQLNWLNSNLLNLKIRAIKNINMVSWLFFIVMNCDWIVIKLLSNGYRTALFVYRIVINCVSPLHLHFSEFFRFRFRC